MIEWMNDWIDDKAVVLFTDALGGNVVRLHTILQI
jgi:hypothetical protein